jgi:hypothetical protein
MNQEDQQQMTAAANIDTTIGQMPSQEEHEMGFEPAWAEPAWRIDLFELDVDNLQELAKRLNDEVDARVWNTLQSLTIPHSQSIRFDPVLQSGSAEAILITEVFQDPEDIMTLAVSVKKEDADAKKMEFQFLPPRERFAVLQRLVEMKTAWENQEAKQR